MKTINQIFDEMPNVFSSKKIAKVLLKNQHTQYFIDSGQMMQFLLANSTRIGRIMWRKKAVSKQTVIPLSTNLLLDDAIRICKENGLKVMRPTSGWEDI